VTFPNMAASDTGCCGQLIASTTAKIVDLVSGKCLPPGEAGEIWSKR
jgi:hypothetical protein